ncbi:MAG TPA: DUF1232 domain-containing protein [Aggregatilineales bacterium]|nr:DUF1232 domain-containing protein [Aggregatilineales bacterium]
MNDNNEILRRLPGVGFLLGFIEQMRLSWRLFRDPRVSLWAKTIPVLTVVYLVSPVDWVVNLIPVLGQLEDIAVLGLGMMIFIKVSPPEVVNEHLLALRGQQNPQIPSQTSQK